MVARNLDYYLKAVARVTGDSGRSLTHSIKQFRIKATGCDSDKPSGVTVRVSTKKLHKNQRKQISDSLRLYPEELDDALENWGPEETRKHLEQYPREVLDSLPALRKFTEYRPKP